MTYALRAIGDVESALSWLTWLSPQGWAAHVRPFGDNNGAVLVLFVLATAAPWCSPAGCWSGAISGLACSPPGSARPAIPGWPDRGHSRSGCNAGSLIGWVVGLALLGAVTGGVASSSTDLLTGNPQLPRLIAKIGGSGAIDGHAAVHHGRARRPDRRRLRHLRRAADEQRGSRRPGRTGAGHRRQPDALDGRPPARSSSSGRWCCSASAGLVAGLINGAQVGDLGGGLAAAMGAMVVQVPATLVLGGLAVALFGWLPRLTSLAWAALVVALLLGQLGAAAATAAMADGRLALHAHPDRADAGRPVDAADRAHADRRRR